MDSLRPNFCNFMISEECMFRCKTCYSWNTPPVKDHLTLDEWKEFLIDLRKLITGPFEINIAGGEPFLKKEIFEFITLCVEQGFITSATSNGYLIDEDLARKISASRLHKLSISIDSIDEATHDFLRGVEGSCRKALAAIDNVHNLCAGIQLGVQTIIQDKNLDNLVQLAEWVQNDCRVKYLNFMAIMQPHFEERDAGWYKRPKNRILWPQDTQKAQSIIEKLIRLKEKGKIANSIYQLKAFKNYFADPSKALKVNGCVLGSRAVNLDPRGNVYLCHAFEPMGNIRNEKISNIWFSGKALEIRDKMASCKENCELSINCFCDEN